LCILFVKFLKSNIFKYSILGLLPECQETTLFRFLDALGMLLREEQSVSNLDSLELELCEAMALMERDFPCVIQDISFHLLHHIVEGIQVTGPVQGMWMFPFERFNSWIARRVTSRRYPEATVMETYRVSLVYYCLHRVFAAPTKEYKKVLTFIEIRKS